MLGRYLATQQDKKNTRTDHSTPLIINIFNFRHHCTIPTISGCWFILSPCFKYFKTLSIYYNIKTTLIASYNLVKETDINTNKDKKGRSTAVLRPMI